MKKRFGVLLVVIALVALMAFSVNAEIPEVLPDDATGKYEITYSGAEPFASYVAVAVEGLYEEDYQLDLSDLSDKNIVYYNVFTADINGDIPISLVPAEYVDATLFIGGAGLGDVPVIACQLLKADALTIADFDIVMDVTEYNVDGIGASAEYVSYKIVARDSYGYESVFPYADSTRELIDYDGEKLGFVENANALQLENTLEAGTYKFSVTYGDITKEASFAVTHNQSAPFIMTVLMDDVKTSIVRVSCVNTYDDYYFNPQRVNIKAEVLDQYLDVMDIDYTYKITKNNQALTTINSTDGIYEFVPVNKLNADDTEEYSFEISPVGVADKKFTHTVKVIVTGTASYTGDALGLYRAVVEGRKLVDRLNSGDIKISDENGRDVHYTESWTTQAYADRIITATADGEAMLKKIDAGEASDGEINTARSVMNTAVNTFNSRIYGGNFAPIEKLEFSNTEYRIADGKNMTVTVTAVPSKPSEKPIYYSENPDIATVNEKTGYVSAKNVGTTRIYARNTDNTISAYYTLEVYTPISSVKYAERRLSLISGETSTPVLTVLPENHSDSVSYSSNDRNVARVDANGKITAVNSGTATITATSGSGKTSTISVTVTKPSFAVTKECIATNGTKLVFPVEISNWDRIKKIVLKVDYIPTVIQVNEIKDLGLIDGYIGTDDTKPGVLVSTWENINYKSSKENEFIEYSVEILPEAAQRKYDLKYSISAYTEGGDMVIWEKSSLSTVIDVGEKDTYTVTVNASTGGNAYGLGEDGTGEYRFGEKVTLRARPSSSYNFLGWYSGASKLSTDAEYTFTVTGNINILAKFDKKAAGGGSGGGGGGGGFSGGGGGGGGAAAPNPQVVLKQVSQVASNVASGVVPYATEVSLSTTTIDAQIYYTLDGKTPTNKSTPYTTPIVLRDESTTISAIAVKSGMSSSNISRFTYRIEEFPVATPVVKKLKEYAAYIKYVPVTSTYFRPNDPATRYEIMEMLSFLFDVSGGEPEMAPFTDVSNEEKALVEVFSKAGVISGYPDGTFGGYRSITRAELVKILSELLNMDVTGSVRYDVSLSDISGHWAENHIKAFVAAGYILGYPEGDFRPDKAVTRAEAVIILNRITGVAKVDMPEQYFADVVPGFWWYSDIMNAANIPAKE